MPSNINPSLEPTKSLVNFRFWCQKVLPLVYDDSLSYYEVLGKMVVQLNDVIDDVNADIENVDTLKEAFLALQTYVNEFFADIDQLASYAERAEAAQTAANQSAINASESATNASASSLAAMNARDAANSAKQAAETSANTASTAATNANTKASEAAQSAITAQTAQASASQSATLAATDRSAAQTAASTATTKANEASESATNAAESASNAENAATSVEESAQQIENIAKTQGTIANDFSNWFANLPLNKRTVMNDFETLINRNIINAKQTGATWSNKAINLLTGEECLRAINANYIITNGIHIPNKSMVIISTKTIENLGQFLDTREASDASVALRLYYASGETTTFRGVTVAGYSGFASDKLGYNFESETDVYILPTFFRTGDSMKQNDEITFRYDVNIYSRIAKNKILANTYFNIEDMLFYASSQIEAGSLITLGTNATIRTVAQALNYV